MPSLTDRFSEFVPGQQGSIAAATQLPDEAARVVYIKAQGGVVHVGRDNTVSAATGYPLADGEESPPLLVGSLSEIWVISATGSVAFMVLR